MTLLFYSLETRLAGGQSDIVTENDLEHLLHLLEGKEGDMEWQSMMERSTPNMAYQAWRHEPKVLFASISSVSHYLLFRAM